jgi:TetR/AcrR family transcriptional regulator, lmrAB and yxaGH operons repressor
MNSLGTNTRTRTIGITTLLLELQGYHATGLNQIIRESATPKGSLYFHFPGGKEELAAEALLSAGAETHLKIQAALQAGKPIGDAVAVFVLALAQDLRDSDFCQGCPVAMVAMETSATSDRLRQVCEQIYCSWFTLVEQALINAGFTNSEVKSWTTMIWASIEGALLLSRTYRSAEPLETVANQLKTLLNQR